jgi:hypothetical protein
VKRDDVVFGRSRSVADALVGPEGRVHASLVVDLLTPREPVLVDVLTVGQNRLCSKVRVGPGVGVEKRVTLIEMYAIYLKIEEE